VAGKSVREITGIDWVLSGTALMRKARDYRAVDLAEGWKRP
jgi:hypothetical protein